MIKFRGYLSDECKTAIAKKISKNNGLIFFICTVIVSFIVLPFGIMNGYWYYALIIILVFVIITVGAFYVPKRKLLKTKVITEININEQTISMVSVVFGSKPNSRTLNTVKHIIDYGKWYEIIFRCGDSSNSIVCQKDLIVQGTIEEFEKLFKGKIIRK